MTDVDTGHSYTIQGIQVKFPYKAYGSQLSMMDKILQGLRIGQHCLLESPTGSGKSLSLLCATLAWLQNEKDLIRSEIEDENSRGAPDRGKSDEVQSTCQESAEKCASFSQSEVITIDDDQETVDHKDDHCPSDDDFEDTGFSCKKKPKAKNSPIVMDGSFNSPSPDKSEQVKRRVPPKIYVGTRTHKQIAQIVRELDKTEYRNVRMSILGSRDYTCVHPYVSRNSNKNDLCQELIDLQGDGCSYFNGANKLRSAQILPALNSPWDLEDVNAYGKKNKVCPYFVTKYLKDSADIIFCPYNYIIDPLIRASMDINLNHNVLILDEAHNMEDSARSAASHSVSSVQLQAAMNDMEKLAQSGFLIETHNALACKVGQLLNWLQKESEGVYETGKTWTGVEFVAVLRVVGWGPEDYAGISELVRCVRDNEFPDPRNKEKVPQVNAATWHLLSGLTLILGYIYKDGFVHVDDYRIVITKNYSNDDNTKSKNKNSWISRRSSNVVTVLNFWCLNPSVAFYDIGQAVHCIVLTSGTLSPLVSFESELNIPFKIKLEANHVISNSQVWVGAIGNSQGCHLNGCFRNTETLEYQDQIGKLVHQICQVTPHGVLCFLPSYSLLDKLTGRWQETGLWRDLTKVKLVLSEPRSLVKNEFDDVLTEFYTAVELSEKSENERGALFFAVCRGKVSEGLDFADNNARAVITIGIPFPNIKALEVTLKRNYNNSHWQKRNLLSGAQWYESQAFRALNQALGRCIRHRNDWGALIMIDERFTNSYNNKYANSLSKWVRSKMKLYKSADNALDSLTLFMNERKNKKSLKIDESDQLKEWSQVREEAKSTPKVDRTLSVLNDLCNVSNSDSEVAHLSEQNQAEVSKRFLFKRHSSQDESGKSDLITKDEDCLSPASCDSEIITEIPETPTKVSSVGCGQVKKRKIEYYTENLNQSQIVEHLQVAICNSCNLILFRDVSDDNISSHSPSLLQQFCNQNSVFVVISQKIDTLIFKESMIGPLNSIFNAEDGMCCQILSCISCHQSVALKVVMSNDVSRYQIGQVWFIPSAIRLEKV